jgi:uncharacterized protein YhbP (UPF0306 family)
MSGDSKSDFEFDLWNKDPASASSPPLEERIRKLVNDQPFGVLCTQGEGQPYGSIVFFSFSEDLRYSVFSTPKPTRKFRLLSQCENIALVVDNRSQYPEDMMKVEGITVTGRATELEPGPVYDSCARLLLERHPYMKQFVAASSTALFRIEIKRYIHVGRFQEVRQWTPPSL